MRARNDKQAEPSALVVDGTVDVLFYVQRLAWPETRNADNDKIRPQKVCLRLQARRG